MEEIEDIPFKEFRLVLITLACQIWTLSRLFQRVPLAPSKLQETLDLFEARLKKISNFLLIEWSRLGSDNGPHTRPESAATLEYNLAKLRYSLASTALAEIYHLFTPIYALCFALNDYNGTGCTDRQADLAFGSLGTTKFWQYYPTTKPSTKIFSVWHLTESILASYPDFSLPSKASNDSGLLRTPSVLESQQYLIQARKSNNLFTTGVPKFGTDPNKIITANHWNWLIQDPFCQLRVPKISTLQLRDVSKATPELFAAGLHTSLNLKEIICVLVHLAFYRRGKSAFTDMFVDRLTSEDNAAAEMLLLRDQARVSIGYGRIKARSMFLFKNCLVFGRAKSPGQAIVRRVSLSDLLQVRYRFEHPIRGSGVLTIYWREKQPSVQAGQEVFGAQVFFDDLSVLKIWAAFLAINISTQGAAGDLEYDSIQPCIEDVHFLPRITRLRDVLSLVPAIKSRALKVDDSDSVLYHLRELVMNG